VVAGTGARGFAGDGGAALQAVFRGAGFLAADADDSIYVADNGNFRIRKLRSEKLSAALQIVRNPPPPVR
jgi:hypothetical protein